MAHRHFRKSLVAGALSLLFAAGLPLAANAAGTYDKSAGTATNNTMPNAPANTPSNARTQGSAPGSMSAASPSSAMAGHNTSLSSSDRKFMEEAARGGVAEVQLGQLAAQKAQNPEVKKFGQRMVDDHSKANDKLKQLASQKNFNLPTDMDSSSKREYDKLQKLSGAQFDREYMKTMVSDHQKDIKEFQKEAKSKDSDLKSFADSTLPTLEDHLKQAKSAEAATKNERQTTAKAS